ncbi:hypothetical protein PROFUN_09663 [Planoprotostelium fungivorum]|uniref:Guanylate cyclase domain-containing protein n=1 Tax=Planoprotostelium fungivorum TaxID=1890364 RepID=A0A2P6NGI8_9EUKA|nr:hypothetical protein PROFUN_09663 [Planoprotostelium fungivorum]
MVCIPVTSVAGDTKYIVSDGPVIDSSEPIFSGARRLNHSAFTRLPESYIDPEIETQNIEENVDITQSLKSFVPTIAYDIIAARFISDGATEVKLSPFMEEVDIIHLWIDVSGFTILAERLHEKYSRAEGEEMLTYILNEYFTQMNNIIERHQGCIFKIAGDAVSVVWRHQNHLQLIHNFKLAADCALMIQRTCTNYRPKTFESVYLSCKAALGLGRAQFLMVGGYRDSYETLLYGDPITQTTLASEEAVAGDIIFSRRAWKIFLLCHGLTFPYEISKSSNQTDVVKNLEEIQLKKPHNCKKLLYELLPEDHRFICLEQTEEMDIEHNEVDVTTSRFILSQLVPSLVVERMGHISEGWQSELRQVSVIFILLEDVVQLTTTHETPEDKRASWVSRGRSGSLLLESFSELHEEDTPPPQLLDNIQSIFVDIQKKVFDLGGTIRQFLLDDKGLVCIAIFGIPAHDDDGDRAVGCSLQVRAKLKDSNIEHSIGITSGRAFCGSVGSIDRREFSVVGDVVNLSARLMGAAKKMHEGILCDQQTWMLSRHRILYRELQPILVKGKSNPVHIYRPTRFLIMEDSSVLTTPTVGRDNEMRLAKSIVMDYIESDEPRGVVLILEGDRGIGKSRLFHNIQEFVKQQITRMGRRGSHRPITVSSGAADSIERQTPFFALRNIFGDILRSFPDILRFIRANFPSMAPDAVEGETKRSLMKSMTMESLSDDYGDKIAGSTMRLKNIVRARLDNVQHLSHTNDDTLLVQLIEVLRDVTAQYSKDHKMILFVEDVHWMDRTSWEMLHQICRSLPVLVIITTRPVNDPNIQALTELEHCHRMYLNRLPQEELNQLLKSHFHISDLSTDLSHMMWEKSNGNPFFALELMRNMIESGSAVIEEDSEKNYGQKSLRICRLEHGVSPDLQLPQTLDGVITSRIDRLPFHLLEVLKAAAVVGPVFTEQTLSEIIESREISGRVNEMLQELMELELVVPVNDTANIPLNRSLTPPSVWRFAHIIIQEVCYSMITFQKKKDLHRRIAEELEERDEASKQHFLFLLAHHWRLGGDIHKAVDYYEKAGEQAYLLFSDEGMRIYIELVECLLESKDYLKEDPTTRMVKITNACYRIVESSVGGNVKYEYLLIGLDALGLHPPMGYDTLNPIPFSYSYSFHCYRAETNPRAAVKIEAAKLLTLMSHVSMLNAKPGALPALLSVKNASTVHGFYEQKLQVFESAAACLLAARWQNSSRYIFSRRNALPVPKNRSTERRSIEHYYAQALALASTARWEELWKVAMQHLTYSSQVGDTFGASSARFNLAIQCYIRSLDATKVIENTRDVVDGQDLAQLNVPNMGRLCLYFLVLPFVDGKCVKDPRILPVLERKSNSATIFERLFVRSTLARYYFLNNNYNRCLYHLHRVHDTCTRLSQNIFAFTLMSFLSFYLETLFDLAERIFHRKIGEGELIDDKVEELLERMYEWARDTISYLDAPTASIVATQPFVTLNRGRLKRIFWGAEAEAVACFQKAVRDSKEIGLHLWLAHAHRELSKSPLLSLAERLYHLDAAASIYQKGGATPPFYDRLKQQLNERGRQSPETETTERGRQLQLHLRFQERAQVAQRIVRCMTAVAFVVGVTRVALSWRGWWTFGGSHAACILSVHISSECQLHDETVLLRLATCILSLSTHSILFRMVRTSDSAQRQENGTSLR